MERHAIVSAEISTMATEHQIQANRQNAHDEAALLSGPKIQGSSTGRCTEEGKRTSPLNAVKTGLAGRTVLLPGGDAAAYQEHVARFVREYQPEGDHENELVRSIADTEWRLQRIPSLEAGIYALGRLELAGQFEEMADPAVRDALIEAKTFLVYQKQLNNLSVQEGRLRRQRDADLQALRERQTSRQPSDKAQTRPQSEAPAERIGFEFATGPLYRAHEIARNTPNPRYSENLRLPGAA